MRGKKKKKKKKKEEEEKTVRRTSTDGMESAAASVNTTKNIIPPLPFDTRIYLLHWTREKSEQPI